MNQLKGILLGVFVGGGLFLAAFPVLFLNEKYTVENLAAIQLARDTVVHVETDKIDPANNGKLIHFTGKDETSEVLTDPEFGVSENAVHLERYVEMYQWVEDKEEGEDDDPDRYNYKPKWQDHYEDSSNFHDSGHDNPPMLFSGYSTHAKEVKVGAFTLNQDLISQVNGMESLHPSLAAVPADVRAQLDITPQGFFLPMSARGRMAPSSGATPDPATPNNTPPTDSNDKGDDVQKPDDEDGNETPTVSNDASSCDVPPEETPVTDDGVAADAGQDSETSSTPTSSDEASPANELPASPATSDVQVPSKFQIGDIRISFKASPPGQMVSVITGQQDGKLFAHEVTPGYEQNDLEMDELTAAQMLKRQEDRSNMMTWVIRALGCGMMFIGLLLVMRPVTALANFVPFLGGLVGAVAFLIAGLVAAAFSLITIAVSWVFVRPIIGIPLLVVSVALLGAAIYFFVRMRKQQEPAPTTDFQ